jgi:hypothetical protein
MNIFSARGRPGGLAALLQGGRIQRGAAWGTMIIAALLAFELFNFSTTEFALKDVLGELSFAGIRWATILSLAFCGIDFAGIARLFTPEKGADEPAEVWYLFGAWLLAASMNATLTWWGVSVAIAGHTSLGSAVMGAATVNKTVPVFVAVMVWLIRVLIIGTISIAGDRLFTQDDRPFRRPLPGGGATRTSGVPANRPVTQGSFRPVSKSAAQPEPTYHNLTRSARPASRQSYTDRPSYDPAEQRRER